MKRRDMIGGAGVVALSGLVPWTATAKTSDVKVRNFDVVIVTVPLGVWKAGGISFDPALPDKIQGPLIVLGSAR